MPNISMSENPQNTAMQPFPFWRCLWLTVSLFLSYLAVSMALPVISIFVHHRLGLGSAGGGLAVGIAFLTTVLTRGVAGGYADTRGGKIIMQGGLVVYLLSSLICLLSSLSMFSAHQAYLILLAGRLFIGLGESMTLVGMMTWGLAMAGRNNAGEFMAMMGAGMYGSFALGSPLSLAIYNAGGFEGVMIACAVAPLVGLILIAGIPRIGPVRSTSKRQSYFSVLSKIRYHGLAVGLQGVGFATIGAFEALMFKNRGWAHPGVGLACFAIGFVCMRVVGPYLMRRMGVRGLVFLSLCIEAVGQGMLWLAPNPYVAIVGSFLTGVGCSMIYPAMGSDVVRIVPENLRGTAMGGYSAFQDIAYGITGPVAGLAADQWGLSVAFLLGLLAAAFSIGMLLVLKDVGRAGRPA